MGDSMRDTVDIYSFEVAVAFDDTLTGGIVGVPQAARITRFST